MTNEISVQESIVLLFHRPCEPLFAPKDNGSVVFDVPHEFHTDRYKPMSSEIRERYRADSKKWISLRSDITMPNLEFTESIKMQDSFSPFNTNHQQVATQLIRIFLEESEIDKLLSIAAYCRDRINPYLFTYALAIAVQHRNDCHNIEIPHIMEQFPEQFIDASIIPKLRAETKFVDEKNRQPIVIEMNYTASDREPEQRLAYFREDIGVNSHHWHWHVIYPAGIAIDVLVAKDRRGELFYYMHSQILARYNNERFCNKLERVRTLNNLREPIDEGYFPKLLRGTSNRTYPGRFDDSVLHDLSRDDATPIEIVEMIRWTDRIHLAIDQGYVIKDDTSEKISLTEPTGIDILGDLVEASILTPNRQLYGNLHNMGHNVIAYIHDPDHRYLEEAGVMAEVTTAMRDPIFYRWHTFIESIFVKYKNTLPPYQEDQLTFAEVSVISVDVQISTFNAPPNTLSTFWQKSSVDLATGMDFGSGRVTVEFTHLQHSPFNYKIRVMNNSDDDKKGTCRIFLIPKADERGQPLSFKDQRCLAIEMDKFTVDLKPGINNIEQSSGHSSITIPYERTFPQIRGRVQASDLTDSSPNQYCACGWPDHMLLPRGTVGGTKFDIFVMVTDYEEDSVDPDINWNSSCNNALSFCGLRNQKYPDKRAMGYPFDKNTQFIPGQAVATLHEFDQRLANVKLGECTITFNDTYIERVQANF